MLLIACSALFAQPVFLDISSLGMHCPSELCVCACYCVGPLECHSVLQLLVFILILFDTGHLLLITTSYTKLVGPKASENYPISASNTQTDVLDCQCLCSSIQVLHILAQVIGVM